MSRTSVIFAISAALPTHIPNASCTITIEPGSTTRSCPACRITDAIDAATPSLTVVTMPLCLRIALPIAMPSNTSPPPELMWISSAPFTPRSDAAKFFADSPSEKNPPSPMSSYTSTRVTPASARIWHFSG